MSHDTYIARHVSRVTYTARYVSRDTYTARTWSDDRVANFNKGKKDSVLVYK